MILLPSRNEKLPGLITSPNTLIAELSRAASPASGIFAGSKSISTLPIIGEAGTKSSSNDCILGNILVSPESK